jgi:dihydroorotate dehydrogenase
MSKNGTRVKKPLFVKIAPDMTMEAINDVVDVAEQTGLTGIIATNTTVSPEIKGKYRRPDGSTWADEMGGFSGDDEDYRRRSTEIVKYIRQESNRRNLGLVIIGVGGINDAATALEKIKAGANLIQLVTAIQFEGLGVAQRINEGILAELDRLRLSSINDLVGIEA